MNVMKLGDATIDRAARSIIVEGKVNRVSLKAIKVLNALIDAEGGVVKREALLASGWPNVFVGEEVLTQAITELRRAFGDTPRQARYIETVPKTGYRLSSNVCERKSTQHILDSLDAERPETFIHSLVAYLSACEAFDRGGRDNIDSTIAHCRSAIEADPAFAPAHACLSIGLVYKQLYYGQGENLMKDALASAQTAIRHDRTSPDGYAAQGFALANLDEFDHALTSFNASVRLSTDSFYPLNVFGVVLFARGAYEVAAKLFDRAAMMRADSFQAMMMSAKAYRAAGDRANALMRLRRAAQRCDLRLQEDADDVRALTCKASIQIELGGLDRANEALSRLADNHDPVTYYIAPALARAGEKRAAIDRLEAIVDNGWADSRFLQSDKDLDGLRREPRFRKITSALAA